MSGRSSTGSAPTSSGDGYDISALTKTQLAALDIKAVGGDVTLTGPVTVYGYRNDAWSKLADLNAGDDIALVSGGAGYSEVLQHVFTFDRIHVSDGGISANAYTVTLVSVALEG